jgi:hypothetical protein
MCTMFQATLEVTATQPTKSTPRSKRTADPKVCAMGQAMIDFLAASDALMARAKEIGIKSDFGLDKLTTKMWEGIDKALERRH